VFKRGEEQCGGRQKSFKAKQRTKAR